MNLTPGISNSLVEEGGAKAGSRLKIWNLTRQTVLAHSVEVADHGAARRKGLLGRKELPAGEGLWIVPCESVHTFWMRFPIDLVYLDRHKKVKKVRSGVPPWRISACFSAHSVLEFASGTIHSTQTKPGDLLEFSPQSLTGDSPTSPNISVVLAESGPEDGRNIAVTMRPHKLRAIAEFLVVAICTLGFLMTVGGICASMLRGDSAGIRDFVTYWASGQQLAHHANPYDGNAILRLERSAGFPSGGQVLIMRNPPSALLFALPLGFLSARTALLLWLLLLTASLVISVRITWIMHGRPKTQLNLLGYTFGPALICLMVGQVSLLVLLGLALFLRLHRSRPFLAGASLWLCWLKPHLFLPFGVVLLIWAISRRSYKVLAGNAAALGISTAIALVLDPQVWRHYGQMMLAARIDRLPIPCLSIMLMRHINPNAVWLQYLPAVLGCAWALWYFRRHRDDWDWVEHGSLLVLVSVVVAPYSWIMDQAILIPALLHAVYRTRSRSDVAILALASAVVGVWIVRGDVALASAFYIWPAPVWLVWYLYALRGTSTQHSRAYDPPLLSEGREATL
jgi:uncharacterized membrane protein (UPF0127 family)